jgi:hypothetical protein
LGQKIVESCYDGEIKHIISLRNKIDPPLIFKENSNFLKSLNDEQFEILKKLISGNVEIVLFNFFNILEENPEYKIIYEEKEQQTDLTKASEMLKAELFIEGGWTARFSKFKIE